MLLNADDLIVVFVLFCFVLLKMHLIIYTGMAAMSYIKWRLV